LDPNFEPVLMNHDHEIKQNVNIQRKEQNNISDLDQKNQQVTAPVKFNLNPNPNSNSDINSDD